MFFYIKNDKIISVLDHESTIDNDMVIEKSFDPIIQYYKYDVELKDVLIYNIPLEKQEEIKNEIGIPLSPPIIDPETGEEIYPEPGPSKYDELDKYIGLNDRLDLMQGPVTEDGSILNIAKEAYNDSVDYIRKIIPFGTKPQLLPTINNTLLMNCSFKEYLADDLGIVQVKGIDKKLQDIEEYIVDSSRIEGRKSLRTNWKNFRLIFPAFSQKIFTICGWFKKPKQWGSLFGGKHWSLFNYVSNGSNYLGFYSSWDDLRYIDYTDYEDKWTHISIVFYDREPDSFKLYINGEIQTLTKRHSWSNPQEDNYQLDDYVLGLGCESDGGNKTDEYVENFRVYSGELTALDIVTDSEFEG